MTAKYLMSKYSVINNAGWRETYSREVVDLKVPFKRVSYCHTAKLKHPAAFLLSRGADLEVRVLGCGKVFKCDVSHF